MSTRRFLTKLAIALGAGAYLIVQTAINHERQHSDHKSTLQSIIASNDKLGPFRVDQAWVPLYLSVPLVDTMIDIEALSPDHSGFFTVRMGNHTKQTDNCRLATYDYSVRRLSSGRSVYSIDGINIAKMVLCLAD